jgi:branched-chain amino acid transport system permease protein
LAALSFPLFSDAYQTNVMISTLLYVMLGLGLNIVVGLAGLLDLGYVAFYAVGAYAYALLNQHFGLGFWTVLPLGGLLGAVCGVLLGFPVLRLRGDYLAIVTLGFGEIIRLVLENWGDFTHGPSGIANIPRPGLFGMDLSIHDAAIYIYYIVFGMVLVTIFVVNRLKNSRIGRAWLALKEDEIACQAMGIDKAKTKLTAFALGSTWAGFAGVIFAAKTTFINPACFTFLESALILSIVVLGGMGSITGVIVGALVIVVLPESLRDFPQFRMLLFGAILVLMMIFRPQGFISTERKKYEYHGAADETPAEGE